MKLEEAIEHLQGWQRFTTQVEQGYELTIYDYTNELTVRSILSRYLDSTPSEVISATLQSIDDRFLSATHEFNQPLIRSSIENAWWVYRVPNKLVGELAGDINTLMKD